MTHVEFISKSRQQIIKRVDFFKDETLDELLYWVQVKLLDNRETTAQFEYAGSNYEVSINVRQRYEKQV